MKLLRESILWKSSTLEIEKPLSLDFYLSQRRANVQDWVFSILFSWNIISQNWLISLAYDESPLEMQLCRTFSRTGVCPYGVRCRFIHSQSGYNWGLGLPNTILPDPYLTYNGVSSPESATSSTHGLGMYGGNLIPENLNPGLTHQSVPAGYDPTLSPYAQYLLATEGATLPRGARERNVGTQANTPGLYNGTQANYSPGLSNYNADLLAEVSIPFSFPNSAFSVYSQAVGVIKWCLAVLPNTKCFFANFNNPQE